MKNDVFMFVFVQLWSKMNFENDLHFQNESAMDVFGDLPDDNIDETSDIEDQVEDIDEVLNRFEESLKMSIKISKHANDVTNA